MMRPTFDTVRTKRAIRDITEPQPIPAGALVMWADYDPCADLYYVEYRGRIYAAAADELCIENTPICAECREPITNHRGVVTADDGALFHGRCWRNDK